MLRFQLNLKLRNFIIEGNCNTRPVILGQ